MNRNEEGIYIATVMQLTASHTITWNSRSLSQNFLPAKLYIYYNRDLQGYDVINYELNLPILQQTTSVFPVFWHTCNKILNGVLCNILRIKEKASRKLIKKGKAHPCTGTKALYRRQRHAPAALYLRERVCTHCKRGWIGPRAGLDRCGKSRPHQDSIPGPSSP